MWSSLKFKIAAARAVRLVMDSSWKLDSSSTKQSGRVSWSFSTSSTGTPMLPATTAFSPHCLHMSPTRAVTVLLPLDPVMARTGESISRRKSSTSPITSIPLSRARWIAGSCSETPGLTTMKSGQRKLSWSKPPVCISICGNSSRSTRCIGGRSRESITEMSTPLAYKKRAQDKPVAPRPTTRALRLFDRSVSFIEGCSIMAI